jgi:hypothetical protein
MREQQQAHAQQQQQQSATHDAPVICTAMRMDTLFQQTTANITR